MSDLTGSFSSGGCRIIRDLLNIILCLRHVLIHITLNDPERSVTEPQWQQIFSCLVIVFKMFSWGTNAKRNVALIIKVLVRTLFAPSNILQECSELLRLYVEPLCCENCQSCYENCQWVLAANMSSLSHCWMIRALVGTVFSSLTHTHTRTRTQTHTHAHTHGWTRTHTRMDRHTHRHTHTHTHVLCFFC